MGQAPLTLKPGLSWKLPPSAVHEFRTGPEGAKALAFWALEKGEAVRHTQQVTVPLIPAHLSPYPSLHAQQDAGAAAAWFPALTTMAVLQASEPLVI